MARGRERGALPRRYSGVAQWLGDITMTKINRATMAAMSVAAIAATSQFSVAAGAQSPEGAFRGMFVCAKMPTSPDILRVPFDLTVSNGNVQFARPLFNWNGTRVLGSEMASGTLDGDGKLHLSSGWTMRGVTYRGDYNGVLTATGGTLTGTQSWQGSGGNGSSRACTAAMVPAPQG
jgi:hypothetical protein